MLKTNRRENLSGRTGNGKLMGMNLKALFLTCVEDPLLCTDRTSVHTANINDSNDHFSRDCRKEDGYGEGIVYTIVMT